MHELDAVSTSLRHTARLLTRALSQVNAGAGGHNSRRRAVRSGPAAARAARQLMSADKTGVGLWKAEERSDRRTERRRD